MLCFSLFAGGHAEFRVWRASDRRGGDHAGLVRPPGVRVAGGARPGRPLHHSRRPLHDQLDTGGMRYPREVPVALTVHLVPQDTWKSHRHFVDQTKTWRSFSFSSLYRKSNKMRNWTPEERRFYLRSPWWLSYPVYLNKSEMKISTKSQKKLSHLLYKFWNCQKNCEKASQQPRRTMVYFCATKQPHHHRRPK